MKMKIFLRVAVTFFILTLAFGTLTAQQTGEIRGKVTEEKGEVLPRVSITARSPNLQGLRTAVSDKSGNFLLALLPVGTYSLTFELPGFEKLTVSGQDVRLAFTVSLHVVLKPAAVREEVTVLALAPLIDKTKSDNSYRLNGSDLALVPTQARTIAEIVNLTPGVTGVRMNAVTGGASATVGTLPTTETGLPSFRGEGDMGNNWLVDGLSTKGVNYNGPGVRLNYDAWEEVQIISDGFAPELGQGLGGFINIVTKSGSNSFHGQLGGLIQDSGLRAKRQEQLSVVSLPETSLQQYFGNLGGPIIQDKLWFFLSDNYFGKFDKSSQQSIGWLTVPGGERRFTTNNIFGKITFTPFKNHTLSLSGTLDKFLNQTGGIGVLETYTKTTYTRYSYRINYRGILSQNTLLTAAWGQNRNDTNTQPLSGNYGPPQYSWYDIAQTTNNTLVGERSLEQRTDLAIGMTHYLDLGRGGSHEIRAGWSYYSNKYNDAIHWTGLDADPWPANGFDNGIWIGWASPGIPVQLNEYGFGEGKDSTRGFGFYAEDNFVLGRLSLMLGLRTETQQVFNDVGTKLWSWGIADFLQARASAAFDMTGDGHNVLKFGYGMYSLPISTSSLSFLNRNPQFVLRGFGWVGAENPTETQLKDPTNWALLFEQSGTATPGYLDPNLKPNKMNKFLLEFDRRLGTNWALKFRGIYSYSHNLIEDIALYDPGTESEEKWRLTNFEMKKRDYRALEVELNGKIPGRLMLNASYTWSQAKGTNPGDFFEFPTWDMPGGSLYDVSAFGDRPLMPEGAEKKALYDQIYAGLGGKGIGDEGWYGFLPYSVDHVVKIFATYFAPYGFNVSTNVEYLSGYHWEKKGLLEAYGGYFTFPEGRGGRTTPPHMYVDLAVEKDFRLGRGLLLGLGVNVYNLMNSQQPVSYVKEDNELFGQVWARQLPRWVQIKATLKF
jgi:hypothetical protein